MNDIVKKDETTLPVLMEQVEDKIPIKILTTNVSSKSRSTTKVFTERGLYMLATILKGKTAKKHDFHHH